MVFRVVFICNLLHRSTSLLELSFRLPMDEEKREAVRKGDRREGAPASLKLTHNGRSGGNMLD